MSDKLPAIRQAPYIGGYSFALKPSAMGVEWETARQEQRLSDGTLNRATQIPYTSAPICPTKGTWTLTWSNVCQADKEILERIVSYQASLDFCPWTYVCESFTGGTTGTLQRRNAIDVILAPHLPASYSTLYAHWSYEAGSAGNITLGAIDSVNYRQAWAAGNATLSEILYFPVFRVMLSSFKQTFVLPHVEAWTIVLREV